MTTPNPTKRTKLTIAITALAAAVVLIAGSAIARSLTAPAAEQPSASTYTVKDDPGGRTQAAADSSAPAGPAAGLSAEAAVEEFVAAFNSMRHDDREPNEWVSRAKVYTTEAYGTELEELYGPNGGAAWTEFKETRGRLAAADLRVTAFPDNPELFMAEYRAQTWSGENVASARDEVKVVKVAKVGEGFRVASMTNFDDQPLDGGPVAPSDMGPELEKELDEH